MTASQLIEKAGFKVLNFPDENKERNISGVYCCDLLSVVMSKGFEDCVWITIMGNINAVAVAALTEMSVIVLAEGTAIDENMLPKAEMQGITVVQSDKPIYETAVMIHDLLKENA